MLDGKTLGMRLSQVKLLVVMMFLSDDQVGSHSRMVKRLKGTHVSSLGSSTAAAHVILASSPWFAAHTSAKSRYSFAGLVLRSAAAPLASPVQNLTSMQNMRITVLQAATCGVLKLVMVGCFHSGVAVIVFHARVSATVSILGGGVVVGGGGGGVGVGCAAW